MAAEIIVQSILPMAEFARILTEQAASLPAELAEALTPISAGTGWYHCNTPNMYKCYNWG